ncbi:CbtB domain-containing protein [Rhodococcus sp. (in: high G+C Gram-positive bacteria)]|uniref:CbtB domain-containing protein n=1 Tax=Rhodococcus sp. TaxID=1831 RepID=UPI001A342962|nr:CbtB domain-containing protein [Rhodococcus sp. (in: high G+C Gram-positive bacteria)]MBJ7478180.1 CbtB-domain containing protein [Rhodococcus sp. (in: high G+C Gram-positive bacteria)]
MALAYSPDTSIDSTRLAFLAGAVVLFAMLALYLVGFDQGAISRTGMYMHELMHDGRHLMGLPCH